MAVFVASEDYVSLLLKLPVEARIVLGGVPLQKAEAVDQKLVLVDEATGGIEDAEGVGVQLDHLLLRAVHLRDAVVVGHDGREAEADGHADILGQQASVEPLQAVLRQRFGEVGDHSRQVEGRLSRIDRIDGGLLPALVLVFMVAELSHTRSRGFPLAELSIHISGFLIVEVFEVVGS
ncbi:hypothetical protein PG995_009087 [Apiospora arundinis]